ncbi:hypothetical protein TNCV_3452061, partial [Trichonephila clavipes]
MNRRRSEVRANFAAPCGRSSYVARRHCPIGPASSRRHPLMAS